MLPLNFVFPRARFSNSHKHQTTMPCCGSTQPESKEPVVVEKYIDIWTESPFDSHSLLSQARLLHEKHQEERRETTGAAKAPSKKKKKLKSKKSKKLKSDYSSQSALSVALSSNAEQSLWQEIQELQKQEFWIHTAGAVTVSDTYHYTEEYEKIVFVGKGSFGKILLARKLQSGQIYALKVLDRKAIVRNLQETNVINERKIMAMTYHPNCINLMTSFKDNGNLYFVLEFCNGGDLEKLLQARRKPLPEYAVKFYFAEALMALEYLHMLDIVHRDVKPENFLITWDGHVKLSDFGFAKRVKEKTFTSCGTLGGCLRYLKTSFLKQKTPSPQNTCHRKS